MPNDQMQIVPITQLDQNGVIKDTPPVSLPANIFTDARNVRFKDGAVRKMEGEVNIFPRMQGFLHDDEHGEVQYMAWWPNPNQTTLDRGYYVTAIEYVGDADTSHYLYAILPNADSDDRSTYANISRATTTDLVDHNVTTDTETIVLGSSVYNALFDAFEEAESSRKYDLVIQLASGDFIDRSDLQFNADDFSITRQFQGSNANWGTGTLTIKQKEYIGYNRQGNWQHTLFNGGFSFIINNGIDKPQYITDPSGNTDVRALELNDLPGWDSYEVNQLILNDVFDADVNSRIFDTGQLRESGVSNYIVTVEDTDENTTTLVEDTDGTLDDDKYTVTIENGQNVITLGSTAISTGERLNVRFRSDNPVGVRAAIVRAFGDFLVAGNLVEYALDTDDNIIDDSIIRRLTGVVRSSNVASPGTIPNTWDPFAAGASTADEFVIADTGTVQDLVPLQGNMYLYTNSSISVMRLTGNTQVPLAVQPVTDQYGALTTDAVLEYDGKHFVIGSDDIYLFGGHPGSIQSISDGKIRRDLFNIINPINDNLANLFTLRYAARDEIWVCFPSVNSVRGECDLAYIWNYRTGTWTVRTLNAVINGDIGPVPGGGVPSAIITFNGESGSDGYATIGAYEVQTYRIDSDASIGHAEAARQELITYSTLREVASEPRPAILGSTVHTAQIQIDTDVFAGPNPTMSEYELPDTDITFTYDSGVLYGGAQFEGSITEDTDGMGNTRTRDVIINANQIYSSTLSVEETGTGDDVVVFDSGFGVTSEYIPETSTPINGDQDNNPVSNNIVTTMGTANAVDENSALTSVATADSGSYTISGSGTGSQTQSVTYNDNADNESVGSVTASFTTGFDTITTVTTADVSSGGASVDWVQLGGSSVEKELRYTHGGFSGNLAQSNVVASILAGNGVTSNAISSATYGSQISNAYIIGTVTSNGHGFGNPTITNPGFRTIAENGGANTYVHNGHTIRCCNTRSGATATWETNTTGSAFPERISGQLRVGTDSVQSTFHFGGSYTRTDNNPPIVQSSAVFNGSGTLYYPGYTTTVVTQQPFVTLNSASSTVPHQLSFTWQGANQVLSPNGSFTLGQKLTNQSNANWSVNGTANGTSFTNNSGFSIFNFDPDGDVDLFEFTNGQTVAYPTKNTGWSGNTETITFVNNNGTGSVEVIHDDTTLGETTSSTLTAGSTLSNLLNHTKTWSYEGNHQVVGNETKITVTYGDSFDVENFNFTAKAGSESSSITPGNQTISEGFIDTEVLLSNDVRDTYTWEITGTKIISDEAVTNGTVLSLGEFYSQAASFITNGNVENLDDWTATAQTDSDLSLASTIAGDRVVNNFEFHPFTTAVTNLSDEQDGPHDADSITLYDNLGDELFTVDRTKVNDTEFNYIVSTERDTKFAESNIIREIQFRSGGEAFNPPDNEISSAQDFAFVSTDSEWSLRTAPAANYVALTEEEFELSGNSYNDNGVVVTENAVVGGYIKEDRGTITDEGVSVSVTQTTNIDQQSGQSISMTIFNPPDGAGGNTDFRFRGRAAEVPSGTTLVMGDGTKYTGGTLILRDISNTNNQLLGKPILNSDAHLDEILGPTGQNFTVSGSGTYTGSFTNKAPAATSPHYVAGPSVVPGVSEVTTSFLTWNATRGYIVGGSSGNLTYASQPNLTNWTVNGLTTEVSVTNQVFTVNNTNDYDITFSYQGGGQNVTVAAGTSMTFTGSNDNNDDTWIWSNNPITSENNTGSQTVDGITVTATATTITSNTTLYQAGQSAVQRSFSANSSKSARLLVPQASNSGYLGLVRVSDGVVFSNSDTTNNGNNLGLYGFTPINTDMAHSAGTGTARLFSASASECNLSSISGSGLTSAQITAAQQVAHSAFNSSVVSGSSTTYSGIGVVYDNNVAVMWRTSGVGCGFFTGQFQFGQRYLATNTAGTVTAYLNRNEQSQITAESYTINNPHPFPVTFDANSGEINQSIGADSLVATAAISGSNHTWSITTPTDTEYQYTLVNNNLRAITIDGGSTWGDDTETVQPTRSIISNYSATRGISGTVTRQHLASSETDSTTVIANAITNGVGQAGGTQLPVGYRFTFGEHVNVVINLDEDNVDNMDPTNEEVETIIANALNADLNFMQYFELNDRNDDPSIPIGRFDITARALPGENYFPFGDNTRDSEVFPEGALGFSAFNLEFGGRSGLSTDIVQSNDTEAVTLSIRTGRTVFVDGVNTTPSSEESILLLMGAYPSDSDNDRRINEVVRQHYRYTDTETWTIDSEDDVENPAQIGLTSNANGDHFFDIESPTTPALNPYLNVDINQEGIGGYSLDDVMYPSVTLTSPDSNESITIELNPAVLGITEERKLTNFEIANIIATRFNAVGFNNWRISIDTDDTDITGPGVDPATTARLKLVKLTAIDSTQNVWNFSINYGNTGTTLSSGDVNDSDIGVFNLGNIIRINNTGDIPPNTAVTVLGTGDNLDFRGKSDVRANPTKIMIKITNNDFESGIQYIPVTVGVIDEDDLYNPITHSGTNNAPVEAEETASLVQSAIEQNNRRLNTSLTGSILTLLPVQYSELANFVLDITTNDTIEGVREWNNIVENEMTEAEAIKFFGSREAGIIDTDSSTSAQGGLASNAFDPSGPSDTQESPANNRIPNRFADNSLVATMTYDRAIDTEFDALRPWPTSQVNLNKEYPLFANSVLDIQTGDLQQSYRGGDIGFLFDTEGYESYVERIELALAPEFNTETIQSLALHADGGSQGEFNGDLNQATFKVTTYGTNYPGETRGVFDTDINTVKSNEFEIGKDYKLDIRTQGRFINYRVSDSSTEVSTDSNGKKFGISWNLSGMQADVTKRGTR